ncbi:hypothetical protein JCM15457_1796 [Liquorilactobacillus sucicola DSM 21376 = JCM 15457]|uniref:Gram-positive cocci surface proteins LPxTG domain-containing protein n=1 Tax=Liquorilactobacillus sucicola DSM 21376 = JCM 15457 TaxID=1423806 RepID=A0A023CZB0_9LACO|nr:FIVAR domain-containing protein [Liquorilactobacillus sucicola]KRN07526.1 hypothetical protein FD15_GL000809 [Liquorilactobacillus sucicola DSM 21376 = JCM 15457]GAJ26845.1 hypothetical protein JCM15457_1796 [Liquorilactobacillus sucicola DSM 21376 = JCM 15457]
MDKQNKYKLAKVGKITGSILFASILLSGSVLSTTTAFADTTTQASQTSSQPASSSSSSTATTPVTASSASTASSSQASTASSTSSTDKVPTLEEMGKMSEADRAAALAKLTPEQRAKQLEDAGIDVDKLNGNETGLDGASTASSTSNTTNESVGWHKDASAGKYYQVFSDGTKGPTAYKKVTTVVADKDTGATLATLVDYIEVDMGQYATTSNYKSYGFDSQGYTYDSSKITEGVGSIENANSVNATIVLNADATAGSDLGATIYLTKGSTGGNTNPTNPTQNVDRSGLEALLQTATGYQHDSKNYTHESRQALDDAITAAYGVDETPTATQAQVDSATDKLQQAVNAIEAQGNLDKTDLQQNIAKAQGLVKQTDTYTEVSLSDLASAIQRAQDAENDSSMVQSEIDSANADLVSYINALEKQAPKVDTDKSALSDSIVGAQSKLDDGKTYTDETVANVREALNKAFDVNDNAQATQAQVDGAKTALDNAVSALKVKEADPTPTPSKPDEGGTITPAKVDKAKLQTEYNKAIQYKGADYTDASFSALQQKVSYALSVLGATDPSQSDIDKAAAGLKSGVAGLVSATTNDKQDTPTEPGNHDADGGSNKQTDEKKPDTKNPTNSSNDQKEQSDPKANTGVEDSDANKDSSSSESDKKTEQAPADKHANTNKDTKNVDKTTNSSKSVSDSSSESLNKKTQVSEKAKVVTKSNDTKATSAISNAIPSSSANENVPDVPKTLKNTSTAKLDSKAGSVIAAKSSQKVQEASLPQTGEDKQGSKAITLWGSVLLASTAAVFGFGYMRKYKHFTK